MLLIWLPVLSHSDCLLISVVFFFLGCIQLRAIHTWTLQKKICPDNYTILSKALFTWIVFPGFIYLPGRVILRGRSPYQLGRVILLGGLTSYQHVNGPGRVTLLREFSTEEIKNAPSALLSYISTRDFLRTREKCFSNARGTSFFISFIIRTTIKGQEFVRQQKWARLVIDQH